MSSRKENISFCSVLMNAHSLLRTMLTSDPNKDSKGTSLLIVGPKNAAQLSLLHRAMDAVREDEPDVVVYSLHGMVYSESSSILAFFNQALSLPISTLVRTPSLRPNSPDFYPQNQPFRGHLRKLKKTCCAF